MSSKIRQRSAVFFVYLNQLPRWVPLIVLPALLIAGLAAPGVAGAVLLIVLALLSHHLLHHRYMGKNFNVVLPLADLCFGTLLLRSRVHFKQARGPSVPDVQPRTPQSNPVSAV